MDSVLYPFVPALAAALTVLVLRLLGRWRPAAAVVALPLGLVVGAGLLTHFNLRAVWAPRVMADHLLLVATFGLVAAALQARVRRRWILPAATAVATGWWVAHAPPALPQFWRAGFVVTIYVLMLARAEAAALCAASLAGAVALFAVDAAPVWQMAELVGAASCAALLWGGPVAGAAGPAFIAAAASLASLAGGRAVSGRITAVDAAAAVPLVVAWTYPYLARMLPAWRPRPKARVAVRRRRA